MSKSHGSQNQTSTPILPGWLSSALSGNLAGGAGLPSILQLFEGFPQLGMSGPQAYDIANMFNVANETPAGQYGIGSYSNAATNSGAAGLRDILAGKGPGSGEFNTAAGGLESFVGAGPGTPSAATKAGLNEFKDLQAPGIQNWAASMGLGNSGASLDALAQGQEQALVPLLQSDQANQLAASQALGGLGLGEQQLREGAAGALGNLGIAKGQLGATQTGLEQAAQQQQLAGLESILNPLNTQNQNIFNRELGQTGLASGFRNELLSLLGNLFGSKTSGSSNQTGFDLASFF